MRNYTRILYASFILMIFQTIVSNDASVSFIARAQKCEEQHETKEAVEWYLKAIEADPNHFEALFYYANLLFNNGDREQAITQYLKAISLRPTVAQVYYNLGICFAHTNQRDRAIEYFKTATIHNPEYTKAFLQLGILLDQAGKGSEAAVALEKVLTKEPNTFEAHYHLGNIYKHADKFDDSLAHYRAALKLNPDHIGAILELANTLNTIDQQPEECLQLYKKVLDMHPNHLAAKYNYGFTLKKLGYTHEAIKIYDEVLQLKPDYALAHFSRGLSYMAVGDWERGWDGYDYRWKAYEESPKKYKQPLWDGSNPQGKTILMYAEQGLGDTMQFIRYAKVLNDMGARIIFQTQKPLGTLLSRCPYLDRVILMGDAVTDNFDYQVPLMDLPKIMKTRPHNAPAEIPYLYPDPELVEEWAAKLAHDTNFKIGICWQGNPNYSTQFLRNAVAAKSMHVKTFEPLARIPGVTIYSLQKVSGTEQLNDLGADFKIHDFGPHFDESNGRFMDTAAVIPNLDLIVSVDTGTCHLAAALGAPTWVVLPYPADWRWMLEIEDTPWYPTMRLFRQTTAGDWDTVMNKVAQEVAVLAEAKKNGKPVVTKRTPEKSYKTASTQTAEKTEINNAASSITTHASAHLAISNNSTADTKTLQELLEQVQNSNTQLAEIENQLKTCKCSVYDTQFLALTRKAYMVHNMRQYLTERLRSLAKQTA